MSTNKRTITYNGVSCPFDTLSYTSRNETNQAGTVVGTRYQITVRGWYTKEDDEQTIVPQSVQLKRSWLQNRKELKILITPASGPAEVLFWFSPPVSSGEPQDIDLEWGPAPIGLDVDDIMGGITARYQFTVSAFTKEAWSTLGDTKNNSYVAQNPIASLLRTIAFTIDRDGFTTRTTSGRYTIVPNAAGTGAAPDLYRNTVTPPLPAGFVRERHDFTNDDSGLGCQFVIVDREVAATLPAPLTGGNVQISTRQGWNDGLVCATLSGAVSAPKTIPKADIFSQIDGMVATYANLGSAVITSRTLSAGLYDRNAINFKVDWWFPKAVLVGTTDPVDKDIVATPPSSNGTAAAAGPFGTAGLTSYNLPTPYDPVATTLSQLKFTLAKKGDSTLARAASDAAGVPNSPAPAGGGDLSQINQTTPIVEYVRTRSYSLRTNRVSFSSKVLNKPGVVQQTANAELFVIDAGVMRVAAKQAADLPPFPDPPAGDVMGEPVFEVSAPRPIGAGTWNEYKLTWRYTVRDTRTLEGGNKAFAALKVTVPKDERRASGAEAVLTKGPDGVVPNPK